jgi:hypothetical protein
MKNNLATSATPASPDNLTILFCAINHSAAKRFVRGDDGTVQKIDYNAGKFFGVSEKPVSDIQTLSEMLLAIEETPNALVIRGKLINPPAPETGIQRLKVNFATPVEGRRWVLIDLDKIPLPDGLDLAKDTPAVIEHLVALLPAEFHDCSYHYQLSSSAGMGSPDKVSAHVWFWLSESWSDPALKRWGNACNERAGYTLIDTALFNDVQAHYTAAPIFEGIANPFPVRSALVEKANDAVSIQEIEVFTRSPASNEASGEGPLHPLSQCLFIQHCATEASTLSEPLWYAAACNLADTPGGADYFHEISAMDALRYDKDVTAGKFTHAKESKAPHTCAKLSELGFTCPSMKPDGQCSVTGGRHPVSFAKTIKEVLSDLRYLKPASVRNRKIAAFVIDHLKSVGTLYRAKDDKSLHYFYDNEKRLYAIQGEDFKALCCEMFGLNAAEQEYKFVLADIVTYANRSGVEVEFFRFARFQGGVLYINAGNNQVFRLDGTEIKTVDNGTDGILFRNSAEVEPIAVAETYTGSPVQEHLVDALNGQSKPFKDLYWVFIYSLFFESKLPTKPIVLITGEKGSGKSFAGRALKQALFGREANVDIGLTSDEKNAKAAFANNYFLCLDNVDGKITWMANLLASVSTGTQIKERKLYVNNEEVAFTPRCFVMINSREPTSLKRDDIVDRLLIFTVERYTEFVPDAQLLDRISSHRGVIWRELLDNLNRIVERLKAGVPLERTDQRLADFANVGLLIASVIGATSVDEAFTKLEEERNSMVLEDHPLLAALNRYIANQREPHWVTTGNLLKDVKMLDHTYQINSPQYFGQQLNHLAANLRGYLDIEFRSGPHNTREVRVGRLGEFSASPPPVPFPPAKTAGTAVTTKTKNSNKKITK